MNKKRRISDEVVKAVVADYDAGKTYLEIEREHGLSRVEVTWCLDRMGRVPNRAKRGERYKGTTEDLRRAYEVVDKYEKHIAEMTALLKASRPHTPPRLGARIDKALAEWDE